MNNIIKRVWNQNRMVNIEGLSGAAFQAEDGGHTFQISGIDDTGAAVSLSGTVAGVFRRPDNADIALTGYASGGVASVTLTNDCYAVPGRFGLTIFVTSGGQKTAVYACIGTVSSTSGGAVAGETPQDVVDLINAIEAAVATIPASYTDLMAAIAPTYSPSGLYPVGFYVWYDGDLYRCTTPITTAETWTAGHWTAVALAEDVADLRSAFEQVEDVLEIEKTEKTTTITSITAGYYSANGDFHESSSYGYTPLINVLEGDVVTFKYDNGVSMRFITAYSSGAAVTSAGSNVGVTSYTVPAGIDQIRISAVLGSATPYYYTIERPKTWESAVIDSLEENAMQKTVFLNESMVNRLNPQDAETGKLIKADGTTSTNTDYFITGYIPINGGETLYAYAPNVLNGQGIRTFAAYDKDKNVLPNLGSNLQVTSITQSGDMAYVRMTLWYSGEDTARTQYTYCVCPFVPPIPYAPRYGNSPVFESKYEREKVYVRATDTEAQIIQKFVYAFSKGDCDVIFDRATYNFTSAFATVKTTYHLNENEIPIGDGCRYYFNGSTLVATLDLSTLGDVDYYCNFFGCGRTPSSYEMYDGVLIATDTRYIVHDESSAFYGSYKHLYQNMEMHYHTNLRTETIRKCIGGGTGASGVVEIVGCKFMTDNSSDECVTFHGNSNNVVGAQFDLNIRDSWFSSGFRAGALSQDQTARIFLTGNSFSAEPYVYPEWTKTSFLNEVRS